MIPIPFVGAPVHIDAEIGCEISGSLARRNFFGRVDVAGAVLQEDTLNVTGVSNSSTYVARFSSSTPGRTGFVVDLEVETAAASSQTELRDALLAAAYAAPNLWTMVKSIVAISNALTVVWLDGQTGTISFPTNPSTHLTVTSVAAAAGRTQYRFGRFVEVVALVGVPNTMTGEGVQPPSVGDSQGGQLVLSVDTNTNSATSVTSLLHSYPGGQGVKEISITAGASAALTVAALVSALETAFPGGTVTSATTTATLDLPPGEDVDVLSGPTNSSTLDISATTTDADPGEVPVFALVIDNGETERSPDGRTKPVGPRLGSGILTADADGTTTWAVEAPSASPRGPVYVERAPGADNGRPFDTPSPTRALVPGARFVGISPLNPLVAHVRY